VNIMDGFTATRAADLPLDRVDSRGPPFARPRREDPAHPVRMLN